MADQRAACGEPSRTTRYALGMTLAAALLGWMFDGFEMGLFPLVARPALMELMGPEASKTIGTWFSVIIAMFLVGAACGGIFFGWLGDRIGRVLAAAGTLGAGSLLNYFNEDYARMCAVVSLVYILGIVFIWFCPETKNKPLPE